MAAPPPTAEEVLSAMDLFEQKVPSARETAARGRADRKAVELCQGDARSMGHAKRFFPAGQPLPAGLPVGFMAKCRGQMFVAGLCSTTMHGIELERHSSGRAVSVFAGGNYGNRLLQNVLGGALGLGTCIIEGQGGQQGNNGLQVKHQSFESPGNAGMLEAQHSGTPVRLWVKVKAHNTLLNEQSGTCYLGLWEVAESWLWTNPRDGIKRCRFLLRRLPGQDPVPSHELFIRGETGAKAENQRQLEVTQAFWAGRLCGSSHLPDLCCKCWFVANSGDFELAAGGSAAGRRRRGGSAGSSGGGEGGEQQEGEPYPNIVCSKCGEAEVCSTCLGDEEYKRLRSDESAEWFCPACTAGGPAAAAAAGIPCVTSMPACVSALAAAATAAEAGFEAEVAAGHHSDPWAREDCRRELRDAAARWRRRARRLGIQVPELGPQGAGRGRQQTQAGGGGQQVQQEPEQVEQQHQQQVAEVQQQQQQVAEVQQQQQQVEEVQQQQQQVAELAHQQVEQQVEEVQQEQQQEVEEPERQDLEDRQQQEKQQGLQEEEQSWELAPQPTPQQVGPPNAATAARADQPAVGQKRRLSLGVGSCHPNHEGDSTPAPKRRAVGAAPRETPTLPSLTAGGSPAPAQLADLLPHTPATAHAQAAPAVRRRLGSSDGAAAAAAAGVIAGLQLPPLLQQQQSAEQVTGTVQQQLAVQGAAEMQLQPAVQQVVVAAAAAAAIKQEPPASPPAVAGDAAAVVVATAQVKEEHVVAPGGGAAAVQGRAAAAAALPAAGAAARAAAPRGLGDAAQQEAERWQAEVEVLQLLDELLPLLQAHVPPAACLRFADGFHLKQSGDSLVALWRRRVRARELRMACAVAATSGGTASLLDRLVQPLD